MDGDVVVDACCLINLCAAREPRSWLPALGARWHAPTAVLSEAVYLRVELDDGSVERQSLDLQGLVEAGVLLPCHVEGAEETELYVDLAAHLDDGEALALAIAKTRRWLLSTDDRKARRLAGDLGVKVLTTPEILKRWADAAHPSPVEIREMLQNIERRARFAPADHDPLYGWWRRQRGAP